MKSFTEFSALTANEIVVTNGGGLLDGLVPIVDIAAEMVEDTVQDGLNNTVTGAVGYTLGVTADGVKNLLSGVANIW